MSAKQRRAKKALKPPRFEPGDVVYTERPVRVVLHRTLKKDGRTVRHYLSLIRGAEWVVLSSHVPDGKRSYRCRLRCKPYEVERPEVSLIATGKRVEV